MPLLLIVGGFRFQPHWPDTDEDISVSGLLGLPD